jgi:hypothetical protein
VIPDLGEDLISLVVSRIECYSSCNVLKVENLDPMNGGVVGVFIAPTTKSGRWEAVCRMAHQKWPTTSAGRWVLTVGALTGGAFGLSGGAPDRSCRLSGAPSARALSSARAGAH